MKYFKYLFSRIGFANAGIRFFFLHERNGQIQLAFTGLVIALGIHYDISRIEWCVIVMCIALVLSLEMINTAVEVLCNHVRPEKHEDIKKVKDVAAAAVWWACVVSMVAGGLVFYPYIFKS